MSDILLVHSGFLSDSDKVMRPYPPLWLLTVAAYLKSLGFAVDLVDTTFFTLEAAKARIKAAGAPLVGIYVNLAMRSNAVALARAAKEAGSLVAIGGQEPGNYAKEYLDRGADIVIHGEAEQTFAELIPHLAQFRLFGLEEIDGISFLGSDGEVRKTSPRALIADLDTLPFPDRSLVDMDRYFDVWKRHHGMKSASVMTSRGCPYTCSWCSHSLYGQSHRRRSPANVVAEILELRETCGPDHLFFADDVFTLNRKWLDQFAFEMKRHDLRLPFETISREDRLDEGVIDLLAEMNCLRLWVGAESGSQQILDAMQRRTDAVRMREMTGLMKARGIRTGTFVMVGYEGESWDDIDETARHLRLAQIDDVLTTIVHPVKGTAYYDLVADRIVGAERPWEETTDRALTVRGRRSRRFYRHTQNWLSAQSRLGRGGLVRRAKTRVKSALSRLAMYATRFEVEHG